MDNGNRRGPGVSVNPNAGSATGTIAFPTGNITVTLAGPNLGPINDRTWGPASSWTGGNVGNAPAAHSTAIDFRSGDPMPDTITFSSPVTDPVMAITGLGYPGHTTTLDFTSTEPFTIEAAGPDASGGDGITASGNRVLGSDYSSGVIQFNGTFSQLSWMNPVPNATGSEFTIGAPQQAAGGGGGSSTPEPTTLTISGLGMGLLSIVMHRRRRASCN